MSRHTTYRGTTIDMDSIRRENENVPAIGNMSVNAKGDKVVKGVVTKTADQIARDNHRIQSSVLHTGLKGSVPKSDIGIPEVVKTPVKPTTIKKVKEKELPSGDIIIEDDSNES